MPKAKPNKGIQKRFRVTRNGKVLSMGSGHAHRRVMKSKKRMRKLNRPKPIAKSAARIVRQLIKPR